MSKIFPLYFNVKHIYSMQVRVKQKSYGVLPSPRPLTTSLSSGFDLHAPQGEPGSVPSARGKPRVKHGSFKLGK